MGGFVPLGYDVKDRKLVVNEAEAATVRMIFERFIKIGSATDTGAHARAPRASRGKHGKLVDKGYLYKLLNNRVYIGEAVHKGTAYPGEHQADHRAQALWDKVHTILGESPRKRAANTRAQTPALLKGLIFGPTGRAMTPTHTRKGGKLYRYYVSTDVLKRDADACTVRRVAGGRDRERGRRPGARLAALARDHRRHVARGTAIDGLPSGGRGPRGAAAARSALGRAVPRRAGAHRAAARRARRSSAPTARISGCGPRG